MKIPGFVIFVVLLSTALTFIGLSCVVFISTFQYLASTGDESMTILTKALILAGIITIPPHFIIMAIIEKLYDSRG